MIIGQGINFGGFTLGGPSAPEAPSGTPLAWFKADAITGYNDGDPLDSWVDSTANSNDLLKASDGTRPTYQTNVQNSLPAVRSSGSQYLTLAAYGVGVIAFPNTIFVVAKRTHGATTYLFDGGGATRSALLEHASSWKMRTTSLYTCDTAPNSNIHIHTVRFDNANSFYRRDGGGQKATLPGAGGMGGINIFANNAGGNIMTGDIYEVIVYNGAEDFTDNEAYLNAKWNVY